MTAVEAADRAGVMTKIKPTLRLVAAMLVTIAVVGLSIATHAPAQSQSSMTLKSIRTDKSTTFYADRRPDCAWFNEAVASNRPDCAWFNEAVLATGDSNIATENLKSVASTL